ncbi:uncharacterized protein LOC114753843 [Neltuma alba]|uniref:uncharacterized protein LOC114753843 n=1 Tax=Neltuma alba TaxID=207710 RepID=UPI0010A50900|nr:uncharacterized protein LOC114753843 [Prosopis alba]
MGGTYDPKKGDWWMSYGNDTYVGCWPACVFSRLSESATKIMWGGEVVNSESNGQHTTTQIGSGRFQEGGFRKASFFKEIRIINGNNQAIPPNDIHTYTDQSNCYNVQLGTFNNWGKYFCGGARRNPDCP